MEMSIYEFAPGSMKPVSELKCAVLPERLPAIPEEKLSEAQKRASAEIASGPRGSVRGPFTALMRSPGLMIRMQQLGAFIRFECELDHTANILAGLIVARQWTNQYIWNGHVPQALEAGLSQELVDAIREGRRPYGMAPLLEATYDFVTELLANKGVSDATYGRAVGALGEQGVVELIGIMGYFSTNAMVMNVARTPPRAGKPPLLAPLPLQVIHTA
jgi:4-carboxymuconolactone decarboxylase